MYLKQRFVVSRRSINVVYRIASNFTEIYLNISYMDGGELREEKLFRKFIQKRVQERMKSRFEGMDRV